MYNKVVRIGKQILSIIFLSMLFVGGNLLAGSLEPATSPSSTFVTLADIYNKLVDNSRSTSIKIFNPTSLPTPTNFTLQDIWNNIPNINPGNIIFGNTILGVTGTYNVSNLTPDKVATGTIYGLGLVGTKIVCSSGYHEVSGVCSNTYAYQMSSWNRKYSDNETLPGGIYFPTMAQSGYGHGYPLVFDNSNKLYAGYYRGYIYSTDAGQTWTIVDLSKVIAQSTKWTFVTVSPDGQKIWVSVPGTGVFISRNSGLTFATESHLTGLDLSSILNVLQSPYNSSHLLAFTSRDTGYGQRAGQIYRSTNSGSTWQSLNVSIANAGSPGPSGMDPIAFEPGDINTFYFISMPSSTPGTSVLYVTHDGGTTFSSISGGIMSYASGVGRSDDGSGGRLIISGACAYPKHTAISSISWSNVGGSNSGCGYDSTITVHPLNLNDVYIWNKGGYSLDGGKTVQNPTIPISNPDSVFSRAFEEPFQNNTFFMASVYGKLLKSVDGGANWSVVGAMPYSQ